MTKFPPFDYAKYKPLLVDSTGRRLTSGLFEELADPASSIKPIFKLAEWRKVYVEIADPTDYKAALHLLGDWEHWQWLLERSAAFAADVQSWREEVHVKLASEGVEELRKQAKTPKGVTAAKWLAEKGFVLKNRGRPPKGKEPEAPDTLRVGADYKRLLGDK